MYGAKLHEDWMNRKWRPAMGWTYMFICILDFAVFPVLWSIIQATHSGTVSTQWDPITLKGAGLFHMAMGAILGIAAWSRGQEKIMNATGPAQPVESRPNRITKPVQPPEPEL
jgi:Holin of 3TMs, for gene-transfer release